MPGGRGSHMPSHSRRPERGSQIPIGWEHIRKIGQGSQGTASLVQHTRTGQLAVRKTMDEYETMSNGTPLEAYILQSVLPRSKRIIETISHGFETNQNNKRQLVQISEYCQGGDLEHALRGAFGIPEDFVWHCFIQLAKALDAIHNGGSEAVVHGDIKPANIFLDKKIRHGSAWPNLKVGDFGSAILEKRGEGTHVTLAFAGPELPYTSRAGDIWSLGATIHWLCHDDRDMIQRPPAGFRGTMQEWQMRPEARKPTPLPRRYSSKLNSYMLDCLEWDPRDRISSRKLVDRLQRDRPRQR